MLCDWLTLRYEIKTQGDIELLEALAKDRDKIVQLRGGEIVKQWFGRESVKTDTHQVMVQPSFSAITIQGSPARVMQQSNVFGSADPRECGRAMLRAVSAGYGVILPTLAAWRVTRVDLTQNYDCGPHVAEALDSLRQVAGGHLKVRSRGLSAIWNEGSSFWSAIAYPKGPHLEKQVRKGLVHESSEHIELAKRLLRLEIRLRNHYLRRSAISIADFSEEAAMKHFVLHAQKLIPENGCEVTSEQQFADRLVSLFGGRRGRALLGTWGLICQIGEQGARERMSRSTFFRHLKELQQAGLGRADFAARNIVGFRPRSITARPVDSWADLKRAA